MPLLRGLDALFNTIFTVEAGLKLVAFGPQAYATSVICLFELAVVVSSWVSIILQSGGVFAVLRALRPLLVMATMESMRLVLGCLGFALIDLISFASVLVFFFVLFAVMALQLFGGVLRNRCWLPASPDCGAWDGAAADSCGVYVGIDVQEGHTPVGF